MHLDSPQANGWESARDEGSRLLEQRNFEAAIEVLHEPVQCDPSGQSQALMGLACFQRENYAGAVRSYAAALALHPDRAEWHEMLATARANATAEIRVPIPPVYYFDRQTLIQSAARIPDVLPVPAHPRRKLWSERARQAGSAKVTARFGIAALLSSFGRQHPGQLVLNNFPRFMQELSIPGNPLFDMGAVDILRARERGVPRYNEFRRQLGLNPIRSFDDLTDDPAQVRMLKEVYGDQSGDVESLDLMIGTLSEGHRPTHFGFGETMFQIFIMNATRRLQADRFYTDNYNAETYTREGLDWIDTATFKTVLLRNYPELGQTGLANVSNAFEPWDTDERLDPSRHPLRACDDDLKPDPWLGDAP